MKKKYLLAPGPVQIPPEVYLEMAKPIGHHRTPEFEQTVVEIQIYLKQLFQTKNPVITFSASGTGAMEAAIVNIHRKNDKVLVVVNGKFSERMAAIAETYGLDVITIDLDSGDSVDPAIIEDLLLRDPLIKSVMVEYSETSTGAMNDVEEIAKIVRKTDALLIVDAITALGVVPVCCDDWGLDVVIGGSQKSLMLPPGLSFINLSDRAWQRSEESDLPKFYFDLQKEKQALAKNTTAWTPSITLMNALAVSLKMMSQYGWQNLFEKNLKLAQALQKAAKAMGLNLLSANPSVSVTAIKVPEGIDGNQLVQILKDEYGVTIAGGQEELKGKIIRIGTLGYIDRTDLLVAIGSLESALDNMGYKFEKGSGIKVIQDCLF